MPLLITSWQATLGKRIMVIYVVRTDGSKLSFWRALGRQTIGYFISSVFLSVGFIAIAFTKNKVSFHDMIFDTYVVKGVPNK